MATTEQSTGTGTASTPSTPADFGANEWLVEDMYERYQVDPNSVDAAWHDFFADYRPDGTSNGNGRTPASDIDPEADTETVAEAETPPPTVQPPAPAPTEKPQVKAPATQGTSSRSTPAARPAEGLPAESPAAENVTPAAAKAPATHTIDNAGTATLRGAAARVVSNMELSLHVPTATSVRAVPAKLIADNRVVINNHLRRSRGGKISFTHIIGYAIVRALADVPVMNSHFAQADGKPAIVTPEHIGLGIAIDLAGKNGARSLVVASVKEAETMDFAQFWNTYEDIIRRARNGKLTTEDFAGTTLSLTNPGTIGTNHSVPRLMEGQGTIVGVGAMEYPAEFSGMSEESLTERAISKIMTLTSTYDHRIIQGAQSGEFLRRIHQLLLADDFYDEIFAALQIPYEPVRWLVDRDFSHEGQIGKNARVIELINAYRTNGHLMADTDPLEFTVRSHPDLDITRHGLTLWDLDREFPVDGFAGEKLMKLRDILGVLRDAYCRRVGVEYMHITDPEQRRWLQERIEVKAAQPSRDAQLHILGRLNVAEAFETFLQTKYVGQKRFSLEGAETVIALMDAVLGQAADEGLDEVVIGMPHRGRLNVLANIVGKPYAKIFNEFEGNIDPGSAQGSGDVKYHLGADGTFHAASGNEITVSLTANPSHLEAVDPVLEGIVRAKQDELNKGQDELHGAARAHARRRRVRRSGRGRRDPEPLAAARLPHRRHRARDRQQPGRLHDLAVVVALVAVLDRHRPDDLGADLPRERRRPRGLRPGGRARGEVPPRVPQGRRHRHGLLPPPRPQRGRQPLVHPAADVRHHRQASAASGSSTPRPSSAAATSPSRTPSTRSRTSRPSSRRSSSRPATPRTRRRRSPRSSARRLRRPSPRPSRSTRSSASARPTRTRPRASRCTRGSSRRSTAASRWPARATSTGPRPSCSRSARW